MIFPQHRSLTHLVPIHWISSDSGNHRNHSKDSKSNTSNKGLLLLILRLNFHQTLTDVSLISHAVLLTHTVHPSTRSSSRVQITIDSTFLSLGCQWTPILIRSNHIIIIRLGSTPLDNKPLGIHLTLGSPLQFHLPINNLIRQPRPTQLLRLRIPKQVPRHIPRLQLTSSTCRGAFFHEGANLVLVIFGDSHPWSVVYAVFVTEVGHAFVFGDFFLDEEFYFFFFGEGVQGGFVNFGGGFGSGSRFCLFLFLGEEGNVHLEAATS
mmetsp:Transcript_17928/g.38694  ORF Transcript_17928/g.38694 Transcript_17928/m.38694 type:complete len:265 (-) Transcript_17928:154-948(-)